MPNDTSHRDRPAVSGALVGNAVAVLVVAVLALILLVVDPAGLRRIIDVRRDAPPPTADLSSEAIGLCESHVATRLGQDRSAIRFSSSATSRQGGGWEITGSAQLPLPSRASFACEVSVIGDEKPLLWVSSLKVTERPPQ